MRAAGSVHIFTKCYGKYLSSNLPAICVCSKYRNAKISKTWSNMPFGVISNLINEANCKTIIVNGVEDHVHCFVGLKPVITISELMKTVKAKSSKYINDNKLTAERFEWQEGYGVFSYSQSQVDKVYKYIQNQETHHKNKLSEMNILASSKTLKSSMMSNIFFRSWFENATYLRHSTYISGFYHRIKIRCYNMFRAYGYIRGNGIPVQKRGAVNAVGIITGL